MGYILEYLFTWMDVLCTAFLMTLILPVCVRVCVCPGLAVATLTSSVRTEGQSRARLGAWCGTPQLSVCAY